MGKIETVVNTAFREITKKGIFDIEKGNEPIPTVLNKEMSTIPDLMTEYVNSCGYGCCFVFSAYMLKILEKYDINAYMIASVEENGIRASVLYEDNGIMYIANPVEDVEYFTEKQIKPEDRHEYYIGDTCTMVIDGQEHNDSRYTVEEFCEKYGKVWLLGKMNSQETKTLSQAMNEMGNKCILPPEEADVNIKTLIR